jgi:hypothetical protein
MTCDRSTTSGECRMLTPAREIGVDPAGRNVSDQIICAGFTPHSASQPRQHADRIATVQPGQCTETNRELDHRSETCERPRLTHQMAT